MVKNLLYVFKLLVVVFILCLWIDSQTSFAFAETIVVSDTIPTKTTNWYDSLSIPAFSPAMGQITSITLTLETPILGSVSYENTGSKSAVITSTHAVSINLRMLNGDLLNSTPSVVRMDAVPAFDGQSDFAGPSGATFSMNTSLTVMHTYTNPADLARFYGNGMLTFPISATGASKIEGPGNFDAILRAQAAGVNFALYLSYLPLGIEIRKLTNGIEANDPDGRDLPVVAPGDPIVWSYEVHNTGRLTLTRREITVTDSDPAVVPLFDQSSDDGDGLLTPGETWLYHALGVAQNLTMPPPTIAIVDGCRRITTAQPGVAYENMATVLVRGLTDTTISHYCNPLQPPTTPGLLLRKLTNGRVANNPDGVDVPVVSAGAPITWTYLVTNSGNLTFTLAEVVLTDSDLLVKPVFDATSDNGDNLLAPGERWRYYAHGTAQNLRIPTPGTTLVAGCRAVSATEVQAYENMATVRAQGITRTALSHYCNPDFRALNPGIVLKKLINGRDADRPDDADVPVLLPGAPVIWSYLVTNTGSISFTQAEVTITDDDRTLVVLFDTASDDGDAKLAPGEQWRFFAQGTVRNLTLNTTGITVVAGCDPNKTGSKSFAYRNIGTVQVGNLVEQDPSHYCNLPPTEIDDVRSGEPFSNRAFLPLIVR